MYSKPATEAAQRAELATKRGHACTGTNSARQQSRQTGRVDAETSAVGSVQYKKTRPGKPDQVASVGSQRTVSQPVLCPGGVQKSIDNRHDAGHDTAIDAGTVTSPRGGEAFRYFPVIRAMPRSATDSRSLSFARVAPTKSSMALRPWLASCSASSSAASRMCSAATARRSHGEAAALREAFFLPRFLDDFFLEAFFLEAFFLEAFFLEAFFLEAFFLEAFFLEAFFLEAFFLEAFFLEAFFLEAFFLEAFFLEAFFLEAFFLEAFFLEAFFLEAFFLEAFFLEAFFLEAFFLEAFFLEAFFLEAFFLEAFFLEAFFLDAGAGVAAGAALPAAPEAAPASSSMAWFKISSVLLCIFRTP